MTKLSASTISRQARSHEKAGRTKTAAKLRAQAAKLRREARSARKPDLVLEARAPRPMTGLPDRNKIIVGLNQALEDVKNQNRRELLDNVNQVFSGDSVSGRAIAARAASADSQPLVTPPWYQREEEIAKLMKAAKKPEEFKRELSNMIHASRYDGRLRAVTEHDGKIAETNKQWAINFVSGFIARMNAEAKANGGPLPRAVVVDGVTMARVIDALERAGYTADGVTGLRRAVG